MMICSLSTKGRVDAIQMHGGEAEMRALESSFTDDELDGLREAFYDLDIDG